ncbi:PD-(D/E)XK nuclease family protein [Streptomyces sp. NBC_00237]|uniref:PD-(D/E)XK nuclease family protein n=1 Tax=Streptomyces sp. NBC_00237 TaxID=2975687 RepID=UPI002259C868|nr:PD-(D/E)XK nuclease family protein [Streptomyces sp. NBC_00237]MCX5206704.1 PD-(D/E)XK nuclease family protein [Streptomyces sp. NBC_00237]
MTTLTTTRAPISIWDAAHAVDARRPRSLQAELGASDTICSRRAGYIVAGAERTHVGDKKAAILGTYIHKGLLEDARREYGWLVERSVTDGVVRGHIDVVQLDAATAARLPKRHRPVEAAEVVTVEDVKTKSSRVWDRVVRYGPTAAEMRQVLLYADLLRTVGFADVPGQRYLHRLGPVDVQRIRFRFVCRDTGEEEIQEFPFDEWLAVQARWWVDRVMEAESPEELRRDHDGPGLSPVCDNCPFRDACWEGSAPGAPAQTVLVHDDADRAKALADYVRAHEKFRESKRVKELARAMLDDSPEGNYGANHLGWGGGNDKEETDVQALVEKFEDADLVVPMVPDKEAMVSILRRAGIVVPRRKVAGQKTARSIKVSRAKKP